MARATFGDRRRLVRSRCLLIAFLGRLSRVRWLGKRDGAAIAHARLRIDRADVTPDDARANSHRAIVVVNMENDGRAWQQACARFDKRPSAADVHQRDFMPGPEPNTAPR